MPDENKDFPTDHRRRTFQLAIIGVFLLLGALFAIWAIGSRPQEISPPGKPTSQGQKVYQSYCASCHGPNGEGQGLVPNAPMLDSSGHAWHHADGELQQTIANGGNGMPAFKDQLTDAEIIAVVRHIQTFWLPGQLDTQQSKSELFPFTE